MKPKNKNKTKGTWVLAWGSKAPVLFMGSGGGAVSNLGEAMLFSSKEMALNHDARHAACWSFLEAVPWKPRRVSQQQLAIALLAPPRLIPAWV